MFDRKGIIIIEKTDSIDEDAIMETALEAGAEDILTHNDSFEIQTATESFHEVSDALKKAGYKLVEAEIEYVPSVEATPDEHDLKSLEKMIEILEDDDDVQNVYHNCAIEL
jgi:transcriptional/translational regulatory protein YebC/TACO1